MDNVIAAVPRSVNSGRRWAAYERLPKAVRFALMESSYDKGAVEVLLCYQKRRRYTGSTRAAIIATIKHEERNDRAEIVDFSRLYEKKYGTKTPHVLAQATIQRYGDTKSPGSSHARRSRRVVRVS